MRRDTLQVRIALLLSVALLPLGLLAVLQTQSAIEAARDAYRSGLAAETARAARPERRALLRAFGLAEGMADMLAEIPMSDADCTALMTRLSRSQPQYGFIGFVDSSYTSRCNNHAREFDFSDNVRVLSMMADPQPDVSYVPRGQITEQAVIVIRQPVYAADRALMGFVSLSFPGDQVEGVRGQPSDEMPLQILTFDDSGQVLTSDLSRAQLDQMLPHDPPLTALVDTGERVFSGYTMTGERRDFALVPIMVGQAYALGSRTPTPHLGYLDPFAWTSILFPVLMWLVTLGVALWALQRNVIRPVRRLHRRMREFEVRRSLKRESATARAPAEFRQIGAAFEELADRIIRDEAEQEDKVRERELLLREVHHRVKNNFQLMSSIVNMQIRQATQPEVRDALFGVRTRLASLARFYHDLYATPALTHVRTDTLIDDLTRQVFATEQTGGRRIVPELDLDRVEVSPDQAGQLAMLLTEALSDAIARTPGDGDGDAEELAVIRVALRSLPAGRGDRLRLIVDNPVAERAPDTVDGLGPRLIAGFASQMEADLDRRRKDGRQILTVEFERRSVVQGEDGGTAGSGAAFS